MANTNDVVIYVIVRSGREAASGRVSLLSPKRDNEILIILSLLSSYSSVPPPRVSEIIPAGSKILRGATNGRSFARSYTV